MKEFILRLKRVNNNSILILMVVLCIIVTLFFGYRYLHNADIHSSAVWVDDWDYISYSKAIFNGIFLQEDLGKQESEQYHIDEVPPLFPMLLAVYYNIVGYNHLQSIVFLNALLNALIVIVMYYVGKRLLPGKYAFLPPFLWIIYYNRLDFSGRVLKEPIITLFLLLTVVLIQRLLEKRKLRDVFWLAVLCSAFSHLDERYLFISVLCLVMIIVIFRAKAYRSQFAKAILLFIVVCSLLYTPWMIRNYKRYNRIVILSPRTAMITDKIFGYDEPAKAILDLSANLNKAEVDSVIKGYDVANADTVTEKSIRRAYKNGIIPYKYNWGKRLWYNTISFWQPFSYRDFMIGSGFKYQEKWGLRYNFIVLLQFTIFLPFAVYAIILGWKKRAMDILFMFAVMFINTVQHSILGAGLARYRTVMDVYIYILAIYAVWEIVSFRVMGNDKRKPEKSYRA
ncbi:MAG: glycosyltransferase family 39 protein [Candidatus Cloacimonas sp.]